jgi:FAD/FMN-containing dehydrogenase
MNPLSLDLPWGRGMSPLHEHRFTDLGARPTAEAPRPQLPRGLGRSYGDVCVNDGGALLHAFRNDRLLAFDEATGVLTAEAGATIADLAATFLPRGWFPPVVPGTRFVTLGGAIANDVHGKNHAMAGTFGRHVAALTLVRSDRRSDRSGDRSEPIELTPTDPLFSATVAGLGLTGLIERVQLRLERVAGPLIEQETLVFQGIEAFHALEDASSAWPFTVGWLDTLDRNLRGVFFRGRFVASDASSPEPRPPRRLPPITPPEWLLGRPTARLFNALYFRTQQAATAARQHVSPWVYFWPLDALADWNRLYGRRGFIQYQFVVPTGDAARNVERVLVLLREAGVASYLSVIKRFGAVASPGLLSFPIAGTTVTLDIPAPDARTLEELDHADRLVLEAGGRLYPAKDRRMRPETFKAMYPQWRDLEAMRDPALSSSFWRRVTAA